MIINDVLDLEKIQDIEVITHFKEWINRVDTPHKDMANSKICPYAKAHEQRVVITKLPTSIVKFATTNFTMVVFVAPSEMSRNELFGICNKMRELSPDVIILTDYKDENTYMHGHQTNNSAYSLILCQPAAKLNLARKYLATTDYYTHYSESESNNVAVARNLIEKNIEKGQSWHEFYNQVRGINWPDCNSSEDVPQLPKWVQKELISFGYDSNKLYNN